MRRYILFIVLLIAFLFTPFVQASCDISEVIEMYEDEMSRKDIREECDNTVMDAGSCNLSKVISLARKGYDEDEIIEACNSSGREQLTNVCQTPQFWCKTMNQAPVGTPCSCIHPTGGYSVAGRAVAPN